MALDVAAVRAAVAAAAATVTPPTGTTRTLLATAYAPGAIDPPFAYPSETDGNYHETMDGAGGAVVTLRILTSRSEDQAGQALLDAFLASEGASSVKTAIEAAMPTANVTGCAGYRPYEHAGTTYYGAELTVVVLA